MGTTVLVFPKHLPASVFERVQRVTRQLQISCEVMDGSPRPTEVEDREAQRRSGQQSLGHGPDVPTILFAGLPPGERRIPRELLDWAGRYPNAPIVLGATEPLVRPCVVLEEGRVSMLGAPISEALLARRLRAILADRSTSARKKRQDTLPAGFRGARSRMISQESERTRFWVGAIGAADIESTIVDLPIPIVHQQHDMGVTVIVPLTDKTPVPATDIAERIARAAHLQTWDDTLARFVAHLAGKALGVIHLDASASCWALYWPDASAPLILSSPLRFPSSSRVSDSASWATFRRFPASAGDVVVACSATFSARESDSLQTTTTSSADGQSVLKGLEERLTAAPKYAAAAVVEVFG